MAMKQQQKPCRRTKINGRICIWFEKVANHQVFKLFESTLIQLGTLSTLGICRYNTNILTKWGFFSISHNQIWEFF